MHKVLILADSLALARNEKEDVVLYEETWPYLLQHNNPAIHVINWGRRSRTSLSTLNELVEIHLIDADTFIIQVGVVDGAPRIFSHKEKSILKRLPAGLRSRIINSRKKKRNKITGKAPLKKVDVPPHKFKQYVNKLIEGIKEKKADAQILLIPVVADFEAMESKSKGFTQNIKQYNAILHEIAQKHSVQLVNVDAFEQRGEPSLFCSDGYHINPQGNQELYKTIHKTIDINND